MHSKRQAQIKAQSKAQVGALIFDETPIAVSTEYSNYSNIFSVKYTIELPEYIEINNHTIKLEEDKRLPFGPIYNLGSIELEILKTYIEINLANNFIRLFKSPTRAPIFFN